MKPPKVTGVEELFGPKSLQEQVLMFRMRLRNPLKEFRTEAVKAKGVVDPSSPIPLLAALSMSAALETADKLSFVHLLFVWNSWHERRDS